MVKIKFVDLFETYNFVHFIDKTRTFGQKCLANELDLHFFIIRECTKFLSNRLILSKAIEYTDRQINTIPKTIFPHSGDLKTWRFDEKREGQILHKSNTFSDENVKMYEIKLFQWRRKL